MTVDQSGSLDFSIPSSAGKKEKVQHQKETKRALRDTEADVHNHLKSKNKALSFFLDNNDHDHHGNKRGKGRKLESVNVDPKSIVSMPEITKNHGAVHMRERRKNPKYIVAHDTVVPKDANGNRAANYLGRNNDRRVSTHVVIGKNGDVRIVVPFHMRAAHARGHNDSVGIDFANMNYLGRDKNGKRIYDPYTEAQYKKGARVIAHVATKYAMIKDPYDDNEYKRIMVGHKHVNPKSRKDPSPAFNWKKMQNLVKAHVVKQYEIAKGKRPPQKKKSFFDVV